MGVFDFTIAQAAARFASIVALLLLASALPGCKDEVACGDAQPCAGGSVCADGACRAPCSGPESCAADEECRGGLCMTSACGSGVQSGIEECDVDHPACRACVLQPGFSCSSATCAPNRYRAALADSSLGRVDVIDLSDVGTWVVVRTYDRGFNDQSPWPAWSADGTQLAYAGGPPSASGSVYLFDVPSAVEAFYGYFAGDQPDVALDRFEVVARAGTGYTTYTSEAGAVAGSTFAPSASWPKWDPSQPTRLAFVDAPQGGASGALWVHVPGSDLAISPGGVWSFGWLPSGGAVFYVQERDGACSLDQAIVGEFGLPKRTTLVAGLPCGALAVADGSTGQIAVAVSGDNAFYLFDPAAPIDYASAVPQGLVGAPIRDLAWTPDDDFVAVLSGEPGAPATLTLFDHVAWLPTSNVTQGVYQRLRFSPDLL